MAHELEFGTKGFDILTAGTTGVGAWVCVEAINGAGEFSATCENGDDNPSQTLADGQVTYGSFTEITWVSGTLKCYRNVVDIFDNNDS